MGPSNLGHILFLSSRCVLRMGFEIFLLKATKKEKCKIQFGGHVAITIQFWLALIVLVETIIFYIA
jgi:hypothetical protein